MEKLILGHVNFEVPAGYLLGEAKGWKYSLRNDWPSWDPNTNFPRETEKQFGDETLAKSNSHPILTCHGCELLTVAGISIISIPCCGPVGRWDGSRMVFLPVVIQQFGSQFL